MAKKDSDKPTVVRTLADLAILTENLIYAAKRAKETGLPAAEHARIYVEVRAFQEIVSGHLKAITELRDKMAYEQVPEAFRAEGTQTLTLREGYRITIQGLVRASCRNMEKCIEWMDNNELSAIPKRTINASTLAALAREMMKENKELPDELFNVHVGDNTLVTRL